MQLIYCLSFDYPPDYFATVRVDCFMEVYEFSKQHFNYHMMCIYRFNENNQKYWMTWIYISITTNYKLY